MNNSNIIIGTITTSVGKTRENTGTRYGRTAVEYQACAVRKFMMPHTRTGGETTSCASHRTLLTGWWPVIVQIKRLHLTLKQKLANQTRKQSFRSFYWFCEHSANECLTVKRKSFYQSEHVSFEHQLSTGGGGGRKVPAAYNSKTIHGIEMKFGSVLENRKLINLV